jgi:hypothetical protein
MGMDSSMFMSQQPMRQPVRPPRSHHSLLNVPARLSPLHCSLAPRRQTPAVPTPLAQLLHSRRSTPIHPSSTRGDLPPLRVHTWSSDRAGSVPLALADRRAGWAEQGVWPSCTGLSRCQLCRRERVRLEENRGCVDTAGTRADGAGFKLVNETAFQAIETWRRMRHPNIVGLREAFTTKAFNDNCASQT